MHGFYGKHLVIICIWMLSTISGRSEVLVKQGTFSGKDAYRYLKSKALPKFSKFLVPFVPPPFGMVVLILLRAATLLRKYWIYCNWKTNEKTQNNTNLTIFICQGNFCARCAWPSVKCSNFLVGLVHKLECQMCHYSNPGAGCSSRLTWSPVFVRPIWGARAGVPLLASLLTQTQITFLKAVSRCESEISLRKLKVFWNIVQYFSFWAASRIYLMFSVWFIWYSLNCYSAAGRKIIGFPNA